jgi:hypothetical protein
MSPQTDYALAQKFAQMMSRCSGLDVSIALLVDKSEAGAMGDLKGSQRWEIVGDVRDSDVIIIHKVR